MKSSSTTIRRVLVDRLPTRGQGRIEIPEEESNHLVSVLRLRDGDSIEVLDGEGQFGTARLVIDRKRAFAELASVERVTEPLLPLVLETAVLKGESMDWLIEKCVELGVPRLQPVVTAHTVVRLQDRKGPEAFRVRWQRIADQALKQCGRRIRMRVEVPLELEMALTGTLEPAEQRLWLDEGGRGGSAPPLMRALRGSRYRILLGPEGGFSFSEREFLSRDPNITPVQLGPWVLRAETAGIAAVSQVAAHIALL